MDKNLKKHTDRGWELMAQKLDRVMPVTGRKAGPAWLWRVAAAGLLVAGAGLFFWMKNSAPVKASGCTSAPKMEADNFSQNDATAVKIAENQFVGLKAVDNLTGSKADVAASSIEKNGQKGRPVEAGFPSTKRGKKDCSKHEVPRKNLLIKGAGETGDSPKKEAQIAVGQAGASPKDLPEILDKTQNLETEKPVAKPDGATGFPEKFQPVGKLPGRDFQPVIFGKKTAAPLEKPTKPIAQKSPKNWRIGLSLGLQTVDFQQLNGHTFGLAATRNLSKKTSLTTGLAWARTVLAAQPATDFAFCVLVPKPEYLSQTNDIALEFTDPAKSVQDINWASVPSYDDVQLAVSANVLHRLELPIVLTHKLGTRLHLEAGFSGSWQFMARSVIGANSFKHGRESSLSSYDTGSNIVADSGPISSSRQVNRLLTRNLPRFDVAAVGSVRYDLTRKWQVAAQLQQGLLNQSALPGFQKRLHSARLSVTRWF